MPDIIDHDDEAAPVVTPTNVLSVPPTMSGGTLALPASVRSLLGQAAEALGRQLAPRTRQEYEKALRHYVAWSKEHGLEPFPANAVIVIAYVQSMRPALEAKKIRFPSVQMRLAAIAWEQERVGGPPVTSTPELRKLLKVMRREIPSRKTQKAPVTVDMMSLLGRLWDMAELTNRQMQARAVILLGFALASRRTELVNLDLDDIRVVPKGIEIYIKRSKTDQEGRGVVLGVERVGGSLCPVAALEAWAARVGAAMNGPVFRTVDPKDEILDQRLSDRAVARIVQRAAKLCGMSVKEFAGHSLRAGYVTEAARIGMDAATISFQSRHRDLNVLREYIRRRDLFDHNAGGRLLRKEG